MTEVPNVYFAAVILEVKQSELRVFFKSIWVRKLWQQQVRLVL